MNRKLKRNKDMKKIFMMLALVLLMGVTDMNGEPRSAYGKANVAAVNKIDSAMKSEGKAVEETDNELDVVEAEVDTLSAGADFDDEAVFDNDGDERMLNSLSAIAMDKSIGIVFCIFFFLFGFPAVVVVIIGVLIYKNRKNRYQAMMKAMECGQPLPEAVRPSVGQSDEYLYRKGIKKLFVGGGLTVASFVWDSSSVLTGIGLLIVFYGLGQMATAYASANDLLHRRKGDDSQEPFSKE